MRADDTFTVRASGSLYESKYFSGQVKKLVNRAPTFARLYLCTTEFLEATSAPILLQTSFQL